MNTPDAKPGEPAPPAQGLARASEPQPAGAARRGLLGWAWGVFDRIAVGGYRASPMDMAVVRIALALYVLLAMVPNWNHLATTPALIFAPPPGLPSLLPTPPPAWLLTALNAAVAVSAAALLVGLRARVSGLLLAATLCTLSAAGYSTGKINHEILLIIAAGVLSFTGWSRCLSIEARRVPSARVPVHEPALALLALAIALCMSYAGLAKVYTGWLDLDTQASLGHLARNYYVSERPTWLAALLIDHAPPWLHELGDWATVAFELALLPALFAPGLFRAGLVVAALFHFMVLMLFDIAFSASLIAYTAFAPVGLLVPRRSATRSPEDPAAAENGRLGRRGAVRLLAGGLAVGLVVVCLAGSEPPSDRLGGLADPGVVIAGFALAVAFAARGVVITSRRVLGFRGSAQPPVVYFDGVCGLCSAWVDFVMKRDRDARVRFAPLQSARAAERLPAFGIDPARLDSIVLADDERALRKSDAVLAVLALIGYPRWLIAIAAAVPADARDLGYDAVAAVRYRLFGKKPTCRLPTPEERDRFLMTP